VTNAVTPQGNSALGQHTCPNLALANPATNTAKRTWEVAGMVIEQDPDGILQEVQARARVEGTPVSLRHVALVCQDLLAASGVGLYLLGGDGAVEPVYGTTTATEQMIELQVTLGEGPAMSAMYAGRPVLAADISDRRHLTRWPLLAPAAMAEPLAAIFAFPLVMGAITIGALEVYRVEAEPLSDDDLGCGLLFAELMTVQMLGQVGEAGAVDGQEFFVDRFHGRWQAVHQATGIIAVQLRCSLTDAFLRLRGHAFAHGRRLSEVADEVVGGILRIGSDNPPDTWGGVGAEHR
jgi:GAF domain/ANTAR domain